MLNRTRNTFDGVDYLTQPVDVQRAVDRFCIAHGHQPNHVRAITLLDGDLVTFHVIVRDAEGVLLSDLDGDVLTRDETVPTVTAFPIPWPKERDHAED